MQLNALIILIIITVLISIQAFNKPAFFYDWSFSPYEVKHKRKYAKFFTHIFIHADWGHLIFNMMSLYFLGDALLNGIVFQNIVVVSGFVQQYGQIMGTAHFVVLYLLGGLFSTFWPMIRNQDNPNYLSVGASGSVSAVIFACILWNPFMDLEFIFLPGIPIPALVLGPVYLAFEFWAFRRGKTNIAHDAHIGGAIFGLLYVLIINIDKGKELINQIFT